MRNKMKVVILIDKRFKNILLKLLLRICLWKDEEIEKVLGKIKAVIYI